VSRDRTPWREARFVAVDLETTGLDPRHDQVLSFAAVPIEGGRIVAAGAVSGLVRPTASPPAASIEIHGLREADLAAAPSEQEAMAQLVPVLDGRIPVAHAAWVERGFLGPRLKAAGHRLERRMIDTAVLWRALCILRGERDPGWCALTAVAAALQVPSHRPHVAEGDALTAAQAFLVLATRFEARGHGTVGALRKADRTLPAYRIWHR